MNQSLFARPIAHRGLHEREKGVIENSASAFEAAVARGFGIECDLQLTADEQPIVFHDYELARLTGREGIVRETCADELAAMPLLGSSAGDCPQRLGALLEQVNGRVPLVVEIKAQTSPTDTLTLARRVAETIDGYKGPLVIKSFDPNMLIAIRRAGYRGLSGIVTYRYNRPEWEGAMPKRHKFVLRHLLHWPWSRFTFISCERTALDLPAVSIFRATGMKVMSWTIKSSAEAAEARQRANQIVFEGFDPEA